MTKAKSNDAVRNLLPLHLIHLLLFKLNALELIMNRSVLKLLRLMSFAISKRVLSVARRSF